MILSIVPNGICALDSVSHGDSAGLPFLAYCLAMSAFCYLFCYIKKHTWGSLALATAATGTEPCRGTCTDLGGRLWRWLKDCRDWLNRPLMQVSRGPDAFSPGISVITGRRRSPICHCHRSTRIWRGAPQRCVEPHKGGVPEVERVLSIPASLRACPIRSLRFRSRYPIKLQKSDGKV